MMLLDKKYTIFDEIWQVSAQILLKNMDDCDTTYYVYL
jgi:hypothetical protein